MTAAHCICNENVDYCFKANEKGHVLDEEKSVDIIALLGLREAVHLKNLGVRSRQMERHLRLVHTLNQ